MTSHVEIAARLLRDAAEFFRHVGEQNAPIKPQMDHNARAYEVVAERLERDPGGRFVAASGDRTEEP